jgi:uncharacterized protein
MTMYRRIITPSLLAALQDSPVVLVCGARQVGKTTLVQQISARSHAARYVSFDDGAFLSAASADPVGFLSGMTGPIIIDEFSAPRSSSQRSKWPSSVIASPAASF